MEPRSNDNAHQRGYHRSAGLVDADHQGRDQRQLRSPYGDIVNRVLTIAKATNFTHGT